MTSSGPEFDVALRADADGGPSIEVRGEIDSGNCAQVLEVFEQAVAEHPPRQVTLDLRGVTFIDSAGTRAVILLERSARERGISLLVIPPREQVTELLRLAGVVEHVTLSPAAEPVAHRVEFTERVELELPRDPRSPSRARAEVRELLAGRGQAQASNLVLLTSELVTNAVVHPRTAGQTPIGLRITGYQDVVRVEVEDAGEGFDPPTDLDPLPDLSEERGRGLFLVDRFAREWGVQRVATDAGPRFKVWFELDLTAPEEVTAANG